MNKLLGIKPVWALIIFIVFDLIAVGMGMGVPIFCILLGFIVGWFIVRLVTRPGTADLQIFRKVLQFASLTACFTFLVMLVIWTPVAAYYLNPAHDLVQSGVPLILYEPRASFMGWIVLMILISPFLQLLTTLFTAYITLLGWLGKKSALQV